MIVHLTSLSYTLANGSKGQFYMMYILPPLRHTYTDWWTLSTVSDSMGPGWSEIVYISTKFPGGAHAVDLEPTLQEASPRAWLSSPTGEGVQKRT